MKINVIGATSNLGTKVMNELLIQGSNPQDVIVTVRNLEKAEVLKEQGIQVRYGDYDQFDTLVESFKGTDVLLVIPTRAPVEKRVDQVFNAIGAAKAAGIKRIVFSSLVTGGYFDSMFNVAPFLLYAESKVRLSGMEWTILRSGRYLDPIIEQVPKFMKTGNISLPAKNGKVAFISKDDIARATANICLNEGHDNKVYEIEGEQVYTLDEVAEIISKVTGKDVRFNSITEEQYAENIRRAKKDEPKAKVEFMIETLTSMYRAFDHGEFSKGSKDVELITGKRPDTIEEYLGKRIDIVDK